MSSLENRAPESTRVLMIESRAQLESRRWHRQRLHLVLTSLRRFAGELEQAGFEVDYRCAPTFGAAVGDHRREFDPERIVAMEPSSWEGHRSVERLGVELVRSNHFLCHYEEFATWAEGRKQLKLEDFYRSGLIAELAPVLL